MVEENNLREESISFLRGYDNPWRIVNTRLSIRPNDEMDDRQGLNELYRLCEHQTAAFNRRAHVAISKGQSLVCRSSRIVTCLPAPCRFQKT